MSSGSAPTMLRPMGLLEIVDQTFRLYRRQFLLFFGIAAVLYVPWGVLQAIPFINVVAVILIVPFALIAGAAMTKAVSDVYLGRTTTIGQAYGYIRVVPFLLTILLAYLMVLGGFILAVIPGIIFVFWIAFVSQVFVIEGKQYKEAIVRSKFLIGKGTWAEVIVLMFIVGIISTVIQGVLGLVLGASTAAFEDAGRVPIHIGLVNGLIQALVTPLGQIAMVLLYYDSRIRKEGFDLQLLAQEMGLTPPDAPDQPGEPGEPAPPQDTSQPPPPPPPPQPPSPSGGTMDQA